MAGNTGLIRVQKIMADCGVCSRRAAEKIIDEGRVTVNGRKCELGSKANPRKDIIAVDGKKLFFDKKKQLYYIMLNKPRGYVTTMKDEMGRKCVQELVSNIPDRVYPIGRLDKQSEGLLLMTNDGDFANKVMHPKYNITKTYRVTLKGSVNDEQVIKLSSGVMVDDQQTAPAIVHVLVQDPERTVIEIGIHEGRNRQIRKMCEAVGLIVSRLKRISEGPIRLGMLKTGEWRELKPDELRAIRNSMGLIK